MTTAIQLMLTGALLFVFVFLGVQVETPRKHQRWYEAVMGTIFLLSILLFFGGGLTAIWTYTS